MLNALTAANWSVEPLVSIGNFQLFHPPTLIRAKLLILRLRSKLNVGSTPEPLMEGARASVNSHPMVSISTSGSCTETRQLLALRPRVRIRGRFTYRIFYAWFTYSTWMPPVNRDVGPPNGHTSNFPRIACLGSSSQRKLPKRTNSRYSHDGSSETPRSDLLPPRLWYLSYFCAEDRRSLCTQVTRRLIGDDRQMPCALLV